MNEQQPITKIMDAIHIFRGMFVDGGVCRLRIYNTKPPTVIASEMPENLSSPINNVASHLWPEIMRAYLPERMEDIPPAHFIQHLPPTVAFGRPKPENYSEVVFERFTPRIVLQDGKKRLSYGEPNWQHIEPVVLWQMTGDHSL